MVVTVEKHRRSPRNPVLGAELRRLREWNGLTLAEVGVELDYVYQSRLSEQERGLAPLSPEQARQIKSAIRRLVTRRRAG